MGDVRSLHRALSIVEEIARSGQDLGVTELSRRLGLNKSTVHRLLATLQSRGYVEQNGEGGRYGLGLKILELGSAASKRIGLREVARPLLERLSGELGEAVNLVVLRGAEAVYIDKVDTDTLIRMHFELGKRSPLHCTAAGKVLLAFSPQPIEDVLGRGELPRFTRNTITRPDELRAHLAEVRERGYAIDDEEQEAGVRCVAAPVWDRDGRLAAAVSVSGPTLRLQPDRVPAIAAALLATTAAISRRLGHREEPTGSAHA